MCETTEQAFPGSEAGLQREGSLGQDGAGGLVGVAARPWHAELYFTNSLKPFRVSVLQT